MSFVAVGIAVGGAVLSYTGNKKSREAQEDAERANAAAYRAQRKQAEASNRREADIFMSESDSFMGTQVSLFAKNGVDFSGSALMQLVSSAGAQTREYNAIKENGRLQSSLLSSKASQSLKQANYFGSSSLAITQNLGTLLNAGATYMSITNNMSKSSSSTDDSLSPDGKSYTGTGR